LAARRAHATPAGDRVDLDERTDDVLAFRRGSLRVLLHCGERAQPLPDGEVLVASGALADGMLPPDTAVWLQ
jgi:alpha-glucosidase